MELVVAKFSSPLWSRIFSTGIRCLA